jgi:SOS-response transcriptional repressor LexA
MDETSNRVLGYREAQVLQLVRSDLAEAGWVRSYDAIASVLGIRHKSGVANVIRRLERRGLLRRVGNPGRRTISVGQCEGMQT